MLVLKRNGYQPVRLRLAGVDVWVMIGRTPETGQQQLLIEAPPEVEIVRDELLPHSERLVCQNLAEDYRHLIAAAAGYSRAPQGRRDP